MKKLLLKICGITIIAALTLGLTACTTTPPSSALSTSAPAPQGSTSKADITIAIEATGDIPTEFQNQIDRFNLQSTKANAKILTYAGAQAYETAITGQIAGNTAPDIIWLDGGKKIQEYAENEVIVCIDEYVKDIKSNFEDSLIKAFTVNEKLFGIPKDYNTSVLFYQKDMLQEANIELPKNIKAFQDAAKSLTNNDIYGFGCDPKLNYLYPFIATMGADFISEDGTIDISKIESDEHKAALTMFKTLFDSKYATTPYLSNAGWDGELFGNRKVAMMYAGSWVTGVIEDTTKAGVAALPQDKNAVSMLYTAGWAITEQCKNKEAAAELIRFMSTDEELVNGNKSGLIGLPPTKTAMDKLINEKSEDEFLPVYREVVKNGVAFGLIDSKFTDSYNKALEGMLYNSVSVDDTISAISAGAK